jgi:hypothetical protein
MTLDEFPAELGIVYFLWTYFLLQPVTWSFRYLPVARPLSLIQTACSNLSIMERKCLSPFCAAITKCLMTSFLLMGFSMTSSCMYTMYFNHIFPLNCPLLSPIHFIWSRTIIHFYNSVFLFICLILDLDSKDKRKHAIFIFLSLDYFAPVLSIFLQWHNFIHIIAE